MLSLQQPRHIPTLPNRYRNAMSELRSRLQRPKRRFVPRTDIASAPAMAQTLSKTGFNLNAPVC